MEGLFAALQSLPPVEALRFSRWVYAAVNAGHILGVALLVGAAVPLSLRLFGLWRGVDRAGVVRILAATAASGLALAVSTGFLLFATRAVEYAGHPIFPIKIALVAVGAVSAVYSHVRYGWDLAAGPVTALRRTALISLVIWCVTVFLGRLIAFVDA
jgi:hypothetical protein